MLFTYEQRSINQGTEESAVRQHDVQRAVNMIYTHSSMSYSVRERKQDGNVIGRSKEVQVGVTFRFIILLFIFVIFLFLNFSRDLLKVLLYSPYTTRQNHFCLDSTSTMVRLLIRYSSPFEVKLRAYHAPKYEDGSLRSSSSSSSSFSFASHNTSVLILDPTRVYK